MSVVLRCPNCGTTQARAGECEACHEAKVRYFCTNHDPGVWLDSPTCPQCEARLAPVAPRREVVRREPAVDVVPARQALWKTVLGAALARTARAPAEAPVRGWVGRLVLRLVLIAALLLVALVGAIYWLSHSLP